MTMRPQAHAELVDRKPTPLTSLYIFCGSDLKAGRVAPADELAADCMRRGCAAIAVPVGVDLATFRWPPVPKVAVFAYDELSDAQVHALADALVQAGCDEVSFAGSFVRKRGPFTFMAVG